MQVSASLQLALRYPSVSGEGIKHGLGGTNITFGCCVELSSLRVLLARRLAGEREAGVVQEIKGRDASLPLSCASSARNRIFGASFSQRAYDGVHEDLRWKVRRFLMDAMGVVFGVEDRLCATTRVE